LFETGSPYVQASFKLFILLSVECWDPPHSLEYILDFRLGAWIEWYGASLASAKL
jgi:hypothetical protein